MKVFLVEESCDDPLDGITSKVNAIFLSEERASNYAKKQLEAYIGPDGENLYKVNFTVRSFEVRW